MARTYVVKRGDTLRKIAKARLGDAALYERVAEYNGIRDPNRIAVGQRLVPAFPAVFAELERRRLLQLPREALWQQALDARLEGAIDLNPETNGMGRDGDMAPGIVKVFESHGFTWGGRWSGRSKDPMHFQFCSGY